MLSMSVFQATIVLAVIVIVIGGGIFAARSVEGSEGFSLGGRSAGVPMIAGCIAGTCVGGGATIGAAQLAASLGLSAIWFNIGMSLALIVMGVFYARPLRQTSLETVPQFLRLNYGIGSERFSTVVSSLGILFSAVASSLPGIALISALTGLTHVESALALLVLVAAYAFFGGMKSAGMGGILKMLLILLSLAIVGIYAWEETQNPVVMAAIPVDWWNIFSCGSHHIIMSVLSLLVGVICTQTYIQAVFSASNPHTAAIGAFSAAIVTLPVGIPCALVGMYMHVAHPEVPALIALPTYLLNEAPTIAGAVALGGLVLSIVSSIAGLSLGVGTMLARDLVIPRFGITDSHVEMVVMRGLIIGVIVVALGIAITHEHSQVLFWNYLSMALRGGGVFLPFTIAIFKTKAVPPRITLISMIVSTAVAIAAAVLESPVQPLLLGLIVSGIILAFGFFKNGGDDEGEHVVG